MSKKIIAVVGATGAQGGGLVRAIQRDGGEFVARAVVRDVSSDKAKALAALGAQVVAGDVDDGESLKRAFTGAYGTYCVTFYWAHMSPEKENIQARNLALASKHSGVQHVIWSTLEDTRKFIPLDDPRMPTLMGKYKVPHFDAKGEVDAYFNELGLPVTFSYASFYWDNFIYFGMGPKKDASGALALTLPIGEKKMTGIVAEDIGKCALGVFKAGSRYIGKSVGLASDALTGTQMAASFSRALGKEVKYNPISPDVYRGFGFPGAEDLGNMFQFYADFERELLASRDIVLSRSLDPELESFDAWVKRNASGFAVD
jgi:uncharacterized protein YbjT (DUF2867 family)